MPRKLGTGLGAWTIFAVRIRDDRKHPLPLTNACSRDRPAYTTLNAAIESQHQGSRVPLQLQARVHHNRDIEKALFSADAIKRLQKTSGGNSRMPDWIRPRLLPFRFPDSHRVEGGIHEG